MRYSTVGYGGTGSTVAEAVSPPPGVLVRLSALSGRPARQQRLGNIIEVILLSQVHGRNR